MAYRLYLNTLAGTSVSLIAQGGEETVQNLYEEGGNRTPIPPREISRQGEVVRYGWLLPEDLYYVEARKKGYYSLVCSIPLKKETETDLFLTERSGMGYEPHENVALSRKEPSAWEDRSMFSHDKDVWEKIAPNHHEAWGEYACVFTTPFFTRENTEKGKHRATSYSEMMAFIHKKAEENPHLRLFDLFTSPIYGFRVPLCLFSKDLPKGELTLEEAGEILKGTNKPVIHYQAQLHGNEVAPGEAALGMMAYLGTEKGRALLDKVHLSIIPCLNPEGALIYHRNNAAGVNLNRDYGALSAPETRGSVRAFNALDPVVMIDGHEYRAKKMFRRGRYEDIQLSLGVASNENTDLIEANEEVLFGCVGALKEMGLRSFFYRDHVSGREMVTATRYFAEKGAMTVLIESRGIDLGQERYARRVMGQFTVARHFCEAIAADPGRFLENSRKERAHFLNPFDREFVLESRYTEPEESDPHFPVYTYDYFSGDLVKTECKGVPSYKVPVRTRPRPASYLIPKGEAWEESVRELFALHGISFEEHGAGYKAHLTSYAWEGESLLVTEAKDVTFDRGALEIPVAQPMSHIVSMLFEPDCDDAEEAKRLFLTQEIFQPESAGKIFRKER